MDSKNLKKQEWNSVIKRLDGGMVSFVDMCDKLPVGVIFYTEKLNILACNKHICDLFGCDSVEEFVFYFPQLSPITQPNGELSREKFARLTNEALEVGEIEFEWLHIDKTGNSITAKIQVSLLDVVDNDGSKILMGTLQNTSQYAYILEKEKQLHEKTNAILDALPLCLNLWNKKMDNLMCNRAAAMLFELRNEQQYLDEFNLLSPERQPDGRHSGEAASEYINQAFERGYCKFHWLHCKLNGEEMPSEITLVKLDVLDDEGNELVVGFTRDLREQIAGYESDDNIEDYFYGHVSHKRLFATMAELSDEVVFTIDVRNSLIQFFGKGKDKLGLSAVKQKFPEQIQEKSKIYVDDVALLSKLSENFHAGIIEALDIRFMDEEGEPHYYHIMYELMHDNQGKPAFVMGKIVDIHERKTLELRSQIDLLTNCYNKITAESLIRNTISSEDGKLGIHALFIVDIDNFKAINDNLGHYFGDVVLSEIAENLHAVFRNADIVGRIGGDEFVVLLKNVNAQAIVINKVNQVLKVFNNTYSGDQEDYKVSGSVGVAMFPEHGKTYEELYKAADKALYQSKLRGKDCFTIYSEEIIDGTMKNRTVLENANRIADSYFDAEIVTTTFNLLYSTKEIKSAIQAVIKHVGLKLNADRSYIFDTFDQAKSYHNTYEWCRNGINPEIDNLQNLSYEVLENFFDSSDDKGVFYSNDLRMLQNDDSYKLMYDQGIKSFLHVQIKENGYVKLFLGVDDCTRARVWNEKEINSLLYVVKLISIFLLSDSRR